MYKEVLTKIFFTISFENMNVFQQGQTVHRSEAIGKGDRQIDMKDGQKGKTQI